jgi:hypothetical protein
MTGKPIKNWDALLIHIQTLATLLSFAIWWSAYCLSIPKQRQVCKLLPTNLVYPNKATRRHSVWCVVPTVSKHGYKGNASAIVQGQWEATCNKSYSSLAETWAVAFELLSTEVSSAQPEVIAHISPNELHCVRGLKTHRHVFHPLSWINVK